jgi:hypothetical protein
MKNGLQFLWFRRWPTLGTAALLLLAYVLNSAHSGDATMYEGVDRETRFTFGDIRQVFSNADFMQQLQLTNPAKAKAMELNWQKQEELMLVNGLRTIPYLRDFNRTFTNCFEHRWYSHEPTIPHRWKWQAPLYGRYALGMLVPFRIDATLTNVVSHDPPEFHFMEYYESHERDRSPNHYREIRTFGAPEWKRFLDAGGDLSAIGIKIETNSPVPGFERRWRLALW